MCFASLMRACGCGCGFVLQVLVEIGWRARKTRRFERLVGKRGRMNHCRKWRQQLEQPWVLNGLVLYVAGGDRDHGSVVTRFGYFSPSPPQAVRWGLVLKVNPVGVSAKHGAGRIVLLLHSRTT